MIFRRLIKLLSGDHKLVIALGVFIVIGGLFVLFDSGNAHAFDPAYVPNDILTAMQDFDDNSCELPSDPTHTQFATQELQWLYLNGDPSQDAPDTAPYTVTAGSPITLNIQTMMFVCHMAITNDSLYPTDGNPNTVDGTAGTQINSPYWPWVGDGLAQVTQYDWGSDLEQEPFATENSPVPNGPNNGSVSSVIDAQQQDICFQSGTRYWYSPTSWSPSCEYPGNETAQMTYTAPTNPGVYDIEISVPMTGASWFAYNGDSKTACTEQIIGPGGTPEPPQTISGLDATSSCQVEDANFYIALNVQPIPITISGTVYAYNGASDQGISGVNIFYGDNTCTVASGYTTTNASGQYSFQVPKGNGFCIRIVQNGSSTTSWVPDSYTTAYIDPNGAGPPPSPAVNCNGNYSSYEYQIAEPSSSGTTSPPGTSCDYGVGNNSGYNFVVNVTASLSCEVYPSSPSIFDGSSGTIIAGVNVPTESAWWFGTLIGSVTADLTGPENDSLNLTTTTTVPGYTYGYSSPTETFTGDYAGQYTVSGTANGGEPNVASVSCSNSGPGTLTVAYEPYLRVFGGDTEAGTNSNSLNTCVDNSSATIDSWNNPFGTDPNQGAGTSSAALAANNISGFASGQYTNLRVLTDDPLTFSNSPGSGYGGNFGTTSSNCNPPGNSSTDYLDTAEGTSTTPTATTPDVTVVNGALVGCNIPRSGMALTYGDTYICYIDNESSSTDTVKINGDVTYDLSGGNPDNLSMPLFEIVVKGTNIDISNSVNQLAGTYIAESYVDSSGNKSGGEICDNYHDATSTCQVDEPGQSNDEANDEYNDQLIIDGSFVADNIQFYRSYGTYNYDNSAQLPPDNLDAEEFDYSPINWLAQSSSGSGNLPVQSLTGLPPVF